MVVEVPSLTDGLDHEGSISFTLLHREPTSLESLNQQVGVGAAVPPPQNRGTHDNTAVDVADEAGRDGTPLASIESRHDASRAGSGRAFCIQYHSGIVTVVACGNT